MLHGSLAPTRLLQRAPPTPTRARPRARPRSDSDAFFDVVIIAYSIDFQQGVLGQGCVTHLSRIPRDFAAAVSGALIVEMENGRGKE